MLNQNYMEIYMDERLNKYRYERKYIIQYNFLPAFISKVLSEKFRESYGQRLVNNIYLDNHDFSSVNDNFDGLSERKKYRIRWYGNSFERSKKTLEIKSKSEYLNSKKFYKIDKPLKLENLEDVKSFSKKFKTIVKEKYNLSFLDKKIPTLYNSYKRIYFENIIDNIRLTIDVDLKYFSPITKISYKEKYIIIEIKYNSDIKFINNFNNISFTRYSKYVKGTSQTTFSNTIY
tara:strand:- start:651 stop:1346 length:696 start_codon:yes stop_codon:yes gene_type:complete